MNELAIIENQIAQMNEREAYIQTEDGRLKAEAEMINIFGALNAYGYKLPDVDEREMARLWAGALRDYIVLYGFGVIKKAVMNFIENDTKGYCPKIGDIIAEAKRIGVNPKAKLAKIKAQQEEEALIAKWKREREEQRRQENECDW